MQPQPEQLKTKNDTSKGGAFWGTILLFWVFGIPALCIWCLLPDGITEPIKYMLLYQVEIDHVHVSKKPSDCEWEHAPLGDKGCHYMKRVNAIEDKNGETTDVFVSWEKAQD